MLDNTINDAVEKFVNEAMGQVVRVEVARFLRNERENRYSSLLVAAMKDALQQLMTDSGVVESIIKREIG